MRRPAIPTAASPRWTICWKASRQRRSWWPVWAGFVQDLLLWCTVEFGYLRLADGFVQTSSIMPQKRNPVALEHARGIASKALGQASAIMLAVHNTPFGDIVDVEDDLQPLVAAMFRDAQTRGGSDGRRAPRRAVRRLASRSAGRGRRHDAHRAGRPSRARARHCLRSRARDCVAAARRHGAQPSSASEAASILERVRPKLLGRPLRYSERELARVLSATAFRGGAPDARRSRAGRDPPGASASQHAAGRRPRLAGAVANQRRRRRVAPPRTEPAPCDAVGKSYLTRGIVFVGELLLLYFFQQYFS